jgi:thiamine pyrophosphate-dependent acetolactate synthase large subunit-like protein
VKANPQVQASAPPPAITYTVSTEVLAQLLVNKIVAKNGVNSNIYGVTGAATYSANLIVQQAIDANLLNYIHSSNESAGIYMAAYEAEINNTVGVHFCTAGPGTAMAATAIGSLFNETKPCVIIFGVPTNNFQYIDRSIMAGITKRVIYIDSSTVNPQTLIDDAFYIAANGTTEFPGQGPVALFIHNDMWNSTYTMSNQIQPYTKTINQSDVAQLISKISRGITAFDNPRVIIRVGERVSIDNITLLAGLTRTYPNIYLHLTYISKTYIDSNAYANVGIEGPMGMGVVNGNYSSASVVIDIANNINYGLIVDADVKPFMPANASIFYCLDQNLPYKPASSTSANMIISDPNNFVAKLVEMIAATDRTTNKLSNNPWPNTKAGQNSDIITMIGKYRSQTNFVGTTKPTTASVIARAVQTIYSLQPNNQTMLIKDNHLYSSDVGAVSFIFDSILMHQKVNHNLNFGEFSPIGCSLAAAAGRMMTGEYEDLICVIGDGGFLNVPGYLIDLLNVIMSPGSTKRCLFMFMNDNRYSNVALAEKVKFGAFTDVTSTATIQRNLNCVNMIAAILGSACVKQLSLNDDSSLEDLSSFVSNWYLRQTGYTSAGFYFISYTTVTGTPIIES